MALKMLKTEKETREIVKKTTPETGRIKKVKNIELAATLIPTSARRKK